eukprot:3871953-Amphidinium_carterae.1
MKTVLTEDELSEFEDLEELAALAPETWRPHITLATQPPWVAKDSTAVILAWEEASLTPTGDKEVENILGNGPLTLAALFQYMSHWLLLDRDLVSCQASYVLCKWAELPLSP